MTIALSPQTVQRARIAILIIFFINGALLANWVSRIPQVQESLDLSEGELGLVLLGLAVGVLVALSLVGGLVSRFGTQNVTTGGAVMLCVFLPFLAWMPNAWMLWFNLFLFGMAMSTMDVAMNSQAVEVEEHAHKALMSTFHAAFSIGGFAGAMMGAGMASLEIDVRTHFLIAGVIFLVGIVACHRYLLEDKPDADEDSNEAVFQLPSRALFPLGVVAFAAAIGEGAMADWSGVYLSNVVNTDAATAALGFAVFSLFMTVGRLSGDYLSTRFSPVPIVRAGGLIATIGLLLAIFLPQTVTTLLGFGLVGLGLSVIVPLAFSAAGRLPDIAPSVGIAGVATIGYAGFLAGPPVIGLVAEITSLQGALLIVAVLSASLLFTAQSLGRAKEH